LGPSDDMRTTGGPNRNRERPLLRERLGSPVRGHGDRERHGARDNQRSGSGPPQETLRLRSVSAHREIPNADLSDSYAVFRNDIVPNAKDGDLAPIDPFASFLLDRAPTVVPQVAKMAQRAAVLLFTLNLDPGNRVGQRFDKLLEEHLPGAWRLTCPPLHGTGIKGESKHRAEVVLAARWLRSRNGDVLRKRLTAFSEQLVGALKLITVRIVGH